MSGCAWRNVAIPTLSASLIGSYAPVAHAHEMFTAIVDAGDGIIAVVLLLIIGFISLRAWKLHRQLLERSASLQRVNTELVAQIESRRRSEEAGRINEERVRLVGRATNDVIWDWDIQADTLAWNDAVLPSFGYTVQEMGTTIERWADLVHPDDRERTIKGIYAAVSGSTDNWAAEYRFLKKDGSYATFYDRGFIGRTAAGKPVRMIGSMVDLTRQKLAEQALRESEERFRLLAETVPDIIYINKPDGTNEWVNKQFFLLTGLTPEQPGTPPWTNALHPDDVHIILRHKAHGISTKERYEMRYRLRTPTGGYRWYISRTRPIFNEAGTLVRWFGVATDIDDVVSAQEALRLSEERFDLAVRGSSDGLWDMDIVQQRYWYSPRFAQLLGYAPEEFAHTFQSWLDAIHPDDEPRVTACARAHINDRTPYDVEYRLKTKGGEYRWFRARGQALWDAAGNAVRCAGSITDITGRKKAEADLHAFAQELERSNRELEQFAYVASHDLQEPMRMISGYSSMLARRYRGKLDADADEFLGYLTEASGRMTQMIQDLLAYARVHSQHRPAPAVSADQAVSRAISNLAAAIGEKNAQVTCDPLPAVNADPSQLTIVFQNLISNAIKFCTRGQPVVKISAESTSGRVTFRVKDNGIGIDPKYHDRVFGLFQRLNGRSEYPGSGLGLAICKRIVERHNGCIGLCSAAGAGAEFYFTLPAPHRMDSADHKDPA